MGKYRPDRFGKEVGHGAGLDEITRQPRALAGVSGEASARAALNVSGETSGILDAAQADGNLIDFLTSTRFGGSGRSLVNSGMVTAMLVEDDVSRGCRVGPKSGGWTARRDPLGPWLALDIIKESPRTALVYWRPSSELQHYTITAAGTPATARASASADNTPYGPELSVYPAYGKSLDVGDVGTVGVDRSNSTSPRLVFFRVGVTGLYEYDYSGAYGVTVTESGSLALPRLLANTDGNLDLVKESAGLGVWYTPANADAWQAHVQRFTSLETFSASANWFYGLAPYGTYKNAKSQFWYIKRNGATFSTYIHVRLVVYGVTEDFDTGDVDKTWYLANRDSWAEIYQVESTGWTPLAAGQAIYPYAEFECDDTVYLYASSGGTPPYYGIAQEVHAMALGDDTYAPQAGYPKIEAGSMRFGGTVKTWAAAD